MEGRVEDAEGADGFGVVMEDGSSEGKEGDVRDTWLVVPDIDFVVALVAVVEFVSEGLSEGAGDGIVHGAGCSSG